MSCCRALGGYCERCDLLVGLDGLHVTAVDREDACRLVITVESEPTVMGCPACEVVAHGHGRAEVRLVDVPAMGRPVRIVWRKRRLVCPDLGCPVRRFVEQDQRVASQFHIHRGRSGRFESPSGLSGRSPTRGAETQVQLSTKALNPDFGITGCEE